MKESEAKGYKYTSYNFDKTKVKSSQGFGTGAFRKHGYLSTVRVHFYPSASIITHALS